MEEGVCVLEYYCFVENCQTCEADREICEICNEGYTLFGETDCRIDSLNALDKAVVTAATATSFAFVGIGAAASMAGNFGGLGGFWAMANNI